MIYQILRFQWSWMVLQEWCLDGNRGKLGQRWARLMPLASRTSHTRVHLGPVRHRAEWRVWYSVFRGIGSRYVTNS